MFFRSPCIHADMCCRPQHEIARARVCACVRETVAGPAGRECVHRAPHAVIIIKETSPTRGDAGLLRPYHRRGAGQRLRTHASNTPRNGRRRATEAAAESAPETRSMNRVRACGRSRTRARVCMCVRVVFQSRFRWTGPVARVLPRASPSTVRIRTLYTPE